jgi:hypothetical protein
LSGKDFSSAPHLGLILNYIQHPAKQQWCLSANIMYLFDSPFLLSVESMIDMLATSDASISDRREVFQYPNNSTDGNIEFEDQMQIGVGNYPLLLAIADLNMDESPEIVEANWEVEGLRIIHK